MALVESPSEKEKVHHNCCLAIGLALEISPARTVFTTATIHSLCLPIQTPNWSPHRASCLRTPVFLFFPLHKPGRWHPQAIFRAGQTNFLGALFFRYVALSLRLQVISAHPLPILAHFVDEDVQTIGESWFPAVCSSVPLHARSVRCVRLAVEVVQVALLTGEDL